MGTTDESLAENYARQKAFSGSLGVGQKPALLMVDFAAAYFQPSSALYANCAHVIDSARALLEWARARRMLVTHTRVEYRVDGADGGLFFKKLPALQAFCRGNPLGEVVPQLTWLDDEPVFTKQYASAFFGTSLASMLRSQGVDTLLIAGMSTSGCVRASALDALQNGFIPLVVKDACGDRHAQPHEANLFDLQAKYADVLTLEQVKSAFSA